MPMALPILSSLGASHICEYFLACSDLDSIKPFKSLTSICSLANAFAYWQGTPINNSTGTYFDDIAQAIERIQHIAGDNAKNIRIINGETGWPTGTNLSG
jgi:exo-beta-1,3-glucanase (GH17 family)